MPPGRPAALMYRFIEANPKNGWSMAHQEAILVALKVVKSEHVDTFYTFNKCAGTYRGNKLQLANIRAFGESSTHPSAPAWPASFTGTVHVPGRMQYTIHRYAGTACGCSPAMWLMCGSCLQTPSTGRWWRRRCSGCTTATCSARPRSMALPACQTCESPACLPARARARARVPVCKQHSHCPLQ